MTLLIGGFCALMASGAPGGPGFGEFGDKNSSSRASVTSSSSSTEGFLDPSLYQKMELGHKFVIMYKSKLHEIQTRIIGDLFHGEKSSRATLEEYFETDTGDKYVIASTEKTLPHLESKPAGDLSNVLWWETQVFRKVFHRTTNHGKRNQKNCWNNCDVKLEVSVRYLFSQFNSEATKVKSEFLSKKKDIEIKDGGRQWCTKQPPYDVRYEESVNYFRDAFPQLISEFGNNLN